MIEMRGVVLAEDGVASCPWAQEPAVMRAYHDTDGGCWCAASAGCSSA